MNQNRSTPSRAMSPKLLNKRRRSIKKGIHNPEATAQSSYEDWVVRMLFTHDGKVKEIYQSMLDELLIDPADLVVK